MSRVRNFCITCNNYTEATIDALKSLEIIKYGLLGREIAPTTGMKHLQGYIQLTKQQTLKALQKKLTKVGVKCALFVAKGDYKANYAYCSKDDNVEEWGVAKKQGRRTDIEALYDLVVEGASNVEIAEQAPAPYIKYYKAVDRLRCDINQDKGTKAIKEAFKDAELKTWQKEVVEELKTQDNRTVKWITDLDGNKGKTFLAKYLIANNGAFYVQGGKCADIAYAYQYQDTVVFDFTRSQEEIINYSVIESFKNGILFSPKYSSVSKVFKSCKVLCLSNFYPDRSKLSEDRWDITTL